MKSTKEMLGLNPEFDLVAGVDEVGRGPLAGPVTAACVVPKAEFSDGRITDSKKLSPKAREELFGLIKDNSLAFSVVSVGPRRIEAVNIREASRLAMSLASNRVQAQLSRQRIKFFVDGNAPMCTSLSEETIIKGDSKVFSIAAASILAKVVRDNLMVELDKFYPGYEFSKHKGYPTKLHKLRINELGASPVHRKTFSGVREYYTQDSREIL